MIGGAALLVVLAASAFYALRPGSVHAAPSEADEYAAPAVKSAPKVSKQEGKHGKPAAKPAGHGAKHAEKGAKHGDKAPKHAGKPAQQGGEAKWAHHAPKKEAHAAKPAAEGHKPAHSAKNTAKKEAKPAHAPASHAAKADKHGKDKHVKEGEHAAKHKPPASVDVQSPAPDQPTYLSKGRARLGEFSVKLFDPLTRTMLRADFGLEGTVACQDQDEFDRFLLSRLQFFREQVMIAVRSGEVVDLTDPELALLKRRIVARVNRMFGGRFVQSLAVKDFKVYESVDNSPYVRWQPAASQ